MPSSSGPQSRLTHRLQATAVVVLVAALSLSTGACEPAESSSMEAPEPQQVLPGIDVLLRDSLHLVAGRRIGLITNPSGMDAQGRSTIDRLHAHPGVELVRLFAPEHGLRATAGEGQFIEDSVDPDTSLPVTSIYYAGSKRAPSPEDLDGIDVVVFDMQDVGARYYTYIYSMALSMEAAGRAGVGFVVLDRPNPIGASIQGNVLDPAFATFVGLYALPMRHGMTPGELARTFQGAFGIDVDLSVVPVTGWSPSQRFDATGLPWVPPSPNMPDLTSALHYPGTCLFEGTNLSVGRGTRRPFQQIGAPWLNDTELADRLNDLELPGVRFEPVRFTPNEPSDGKWGGQEVAGVRFVETDASAYDPTTAAVVALVEARAQDPAQWDWNTAHFDRLAGTDSLRLGIERGLEAGELTRGWEAARDAFVAIAEPFWLYERRNEPPGGG